MRARTRMHSSSGTVGPASTLTLNLPTHYVNRIINVTCDTTLIERSICSRESPSRATTARGLTGIYPPGCIAPFVSATTLVWRSSYA